MTLSFSGSLSPALLLRIAGLYLMQGVPMGFGFECVPTLLRHAGTELSVLSFVPLVGVPWVSSFIWAPFVENHWLSRVGRRRSWIIPMQLCVIILFLVLSGVAFTPENATLIIALAGLASLFSATHDIAVDALAAESFPKDNIVLANVFQIGGLALGMLIGGSGLMFLYDSLGQKVAFIALAILVCITLLPTILWKEALASPIGNPPKAKLLSYFKRENANTTLALGVIVTLAGSVLYNLWRLVLVDTGWDPARIAVLNGFCNTGSILLVSLLANTLISKIGIKKSGSLGLSLITLGGIGWILIATHTFTATTHIVALLICLGASGGSLASVVGFSIIMQFAKAGKQPGTDFTLFQSAHSLSGMFMGGIAIFLSNQWGYQAGILVSVGVALTAITSLIKFSQKS